jgi:hypothetical protein
VKAQARNSGSTAVYEISSNILNYPVGIIPASGMKLWLKADAGIGISGGLVASWADQSGNGVNVSHPNSSSRPSLVENAINGRPVVRFDSSLKMLQATGQALNGNTAFTTFTVARFNDIPASTYQYLWYNGVDTVPGGYGVYMNLSGAIRASWGSGGSAQTDPNLAAIGTLYRVTSRYNTADTKHEMWVNGASTNLNRTKTGSNLAGGFFSVGNFGPSQGYGLFGDIAEILIYGRSLSDVEKAAVEQYLQTRWVAPAPVSVDRLKDVKALGDGVQVTLTSAKVAVSPSGTYSDGGVYVTESDRACGMKVTGAGTVDLWDNLTLSGTTDTDVLTGERVLRVTSVSKASGTELNSLGMNGKTVTASGQLVRVWGKVKEKTSSYLTLDDGSGVTTKVQIDGLVTSLSTIPNVGDYVSATGPAGLMAGGVTAVRVRSGSDIRVY